MSAIGQKRSFTDSSFDCVVSGQKQGLDRRACLRNSALFGD